LLRRNRGTVNWGFQMQHRVQIGGKLYRFFCVGVAAVAVTLAAPVLAAPNADTAQQASQDTSSALVQLNAEPLASYVKTKPPQGKKIDFTSNDVKSYRAQLSAIRNDYKAWLHANVPQAKVTGEFDISLNAVAVQLNGATLPQISATPMVKHAEYEGLYHPTAADPDLALISATQAWGAGGSANAGLNVKVAIVDTGIDVTHPASATPAIRSKISWVTTASPTTR
jgi:minor extracellular serine protease Vpr